MPLWITAAQPSVVEQTVYYDNGGSFSFQFVRFRSRNTACQRDYTLSMWRSSCVVQMRAFSLCTPDPEGLLSETEGRTLRQTHRGGWGEAISRCFLLTTGRFWLGCTGVSWRVAIFTHSSTSSTSGFLAASDSKISVTNAWKAVDGRSSLVLSVSTADVRRTRFSPVARELKATLWCPNHSVRVSSFFLVRIVSCPPCLFRYYDGPAELERDAHAPVVLVCTGAGITPAVSVAER